MSDGVPSPSPSAEDTQQLTVPQTPPPSPRRRMSGPTLLAFLAVGALMGTAAGVGFNHWWTARHASPEPSVETPIASLPSVPSPAPAMLFSTARSRPEATAEVLEAGAPLVYCFFSIPDEARGAEVSAWWLDAARDPVRASGEVTLDPGEALSGVVALRPPGAQEVFGPGIYEVALRIAGEPVAEGSFAMLKGAAELVTRPGGMDRYRPEVNNILVFTGEPGGAVRKPCVLPSGTSSVKATFAFAHALSGTAFTVQWLYEDGLIRQATTEVVIRAAEGQADAWFATKPRQALPPGKYAVLVSLGEGTPPLAQEPFWIGRQPRPDELRKTR
ncbi:MAG: hypothetical protein FJX74_01210 [Armatimonadetes bacterium]|nr:hypothetical protein [Armatimonadota bacterium]